ncbi:MAG: ABC transporter ATP-binding protein, partial [Bacillota bacterium]
ERFMSHSAVDPIAHLVRLALATIVMINLQGRLTLVVVPLLIVIPFVSKVLATKVRGLAKAQREASTRLVQHYSESIQSVDLIQSYNQEKRRLREHEGVLNQYLKQSLRLIVLRMTGPISVELLSLIVTHGAVLSIGGWMVRQGQMTPGGLVAFFTYSMRFQSPMMALLRTNLELQQVMVSAGRILEIIESTDRGNKGDRLLPSRSPTTLELQGVSFTYPERERPAVHGVSLSAKAGRGVAIVGHNGSGKSTLTRLINRFLQPSSGRVLVNGVDTTTVDPSIVRGVIGVVDQQAKVLHASIADNIAFGRPNTSLDEIVRVCEMVHLDRFISTLPASYDTMVGPNGVSLSGGERQKISLARCLICNPQIIIFDEPTTGLDPESERDILALIDDLARTKLVVHITHQLQNLTHFDQIVVMSEGAVVAIGNHDQLLTHPVYRSLWNLDVKSEAV